MNHPQQSYWDGKLATNESWLTLALLLAASFTLRMLFFNGPLGSDDSTYLARAIEIANGIWSNSSDIGSLRYGFNIPAGLILYLFGTTETIANLWSLLCSLGEIAIVYLFANRLWGRKAAIYAGLVLATFPLHIAGATRIHVDPVLCFFITLSFFLLYLGEESDNKLTFFFCGAAMGLVFWAKEFALIALFPFFLYPVVFRRLNTNWIYIIAGGMLFLVLHLVLMQLIADDPFHVFKIVLGGMISGDIGFRRENSPWYYLKYLFVDIRHTWIAPFFAVIGIYFAAIGILSKHGISHRYTYVLFWLIALLTFLSLTPISFHPLQFVPKQSNYLSIFLAPIAMLSGHQISILPKYANVVVLSMVIVGGVALSALEQADYRVFTSNSKAAVQFSEAHPDAWILGTENNARIAHEYSNLMGNDNLSQLFYTFDFKFAHGDPNSMISQKGDDGYLIVDQQTMDWANPMVRLSYPLACWREVDKLTPTGFGAGKYFVDWLIAMAQYLPVPLAQKLTPPLHTLSQPKPAIVYRVNRHNLLCGAQAETTH